MAAMAVTAPDFAKQTHKILLEELQDHCLPSP
jgi:hypothetical protein